MFDNGFWFARTVFYLHLVKTTNCVVDELTNLNIDEKVNTRFTEEVIETIIIIMIDSKKEPLRTVFPEDRSEDQIDLRN